MWPLSEELWHLHIRKLQLPEQKVIPGGNDMDAARVGLDITVFLAGDNAFQFATILYH